MATKKESATFNILALNWSRTYAGVACLLKLNFSTHRTRLYFLYDLVFSYISVTKIRVVTILTTPNGIRHVLLDREIKETKPLAQFNT